MTSRYYFQDFSRIEHLELFLSEHIQSVANRFIPDGRYDLVTRIHTIRARGDHRKPSYLCEIRLDTPQSPSSIVIKKQSSNFYKAAIEVAEVLKKVLRRESSRRAQHHRREHSEVTLSQEVSALDTFRRAS
jgi:ribosome-associated translation inhibitor RaiA